MQKSDIVILAVKPNIVPIALSDVKKISGIKAEKLFLSVVMGITTKHLEQVQF